MKKPLVIGLFAGLLAIPSPAFLQDFLSAQEKPLDVPYVPSKPEVVAEMLRMAKVTKDDLLYDLGCGDGRIVITAARLYGTHGVGIDIDPERIKESKENAAKADVSHLVKFYEQDIFEADFREATVVSLYLLTSVNLRLRPKLLTQLRPGTRIVSHNYGMDTWKPDDSAVVMVNDQSHNVYMWIVPANISGTWEWTWPEGNRKVTYGLKFEQHFQWPSGELKAGSANWNVRDVSLKGNELQFKAEREERGKTQSMTFEGRIVGNSIEGTALMKGEPSSSARAWRAKRNPATMKPLDAEESGY
jgi:SAM-dependent methyltransferase